MRLRNLSMVYGLWSMVFVLTGCTVRTYSMTKERIDQDLTVGNQGYLQGNPPPVDTASRAATRETQVIEIEFGKRAQLVRQGPPPTPTEQSDKALWGERSITDEKITDETIESLGQEPVIGGPLEKYTVQKGDTLQKISQKFYGTTKKWYKIYKANQDTLKGPDKVYPGQVINVPVEGLKEPVENLK